MIILSVFLKNTTASLPPGTVTVSIAKLNREIPKPLKKMNRLEFRLNIPGDKMSETQSLFEFVGNSLTGLQAPLVHDFPDFQILLTMVFICYQNSHPYHAEFNRKRFWIFWFYLERRKPVRHLEMNAKKG